MKNVIKLLYDGRLTAFVKYNDHLDEVKKYQEIIAVLRDDVQHRDNCLKGKNILIKELGCDPNLFKNIQNRLNQKIDNVASLHDKIRKQKADIDFFRSQSQYYHDKLIKNRID